MVLKGFVVCTFSQNATVTHNGPASRRCSVSIRPSPVKISSPFFHSTSFLADTEYFARVPQPRVGPRRDLRLSCASPDGKAKSGLKNPRHWCNSVLLLQLDLASSPTSHLDGPRRARRRPKRALHYVQWLDQITDGKQKFTSSPSRRLNGRFGGGNRCTLALPFAYAPPSFSDLRRLGCSLEVKKRALTDRQESAAESGIVEKTLSIERLHKKKMSLLPFPNRNLGEAGRIVAAPRVHR